MNNDLIRSVVKKHCPAAKKYEILKNASDDYFYFTIGDVDNSIDKSKIKINATFV